MAKNILLFFDGTSNKFGDNLTNVVKAYAVVDKVSQRCFYCPGVGSIADKMEYSYFARQIKKYLGLGLGFGLQEKIIAGYSFLMSAYEPGDKICLFGFSRGAYTAKVFAGLLHTCGLIEKGNEYLIQYAYELYSDKKFSLKLTNKFKKRFARHNPEIEFMGLWDSVSSVGSVVRMRNFPFTTNVKGIKVIRHAVAIDELRALYKQNTTKSEGDCKEVWFSGVHSDVGGGNKELVSGLSKVPLDWILSEAQKNGLLIDQSLYNRYVISKDIKDYAPLDALAKAHKNNFLSLWFLLEIIPRYKIVNYEPMEFLWYWPLFRKRNLGDTPLIHESVMKRISNGHKRPRNLPKTINPDQIINT